MNRNEYKDLENQGWEAMFQTLDHEMPVKKKRRGLLWLWLCFGGLTVGSAFLYYKTTKNTPLSQNTLSKPIVSENKQAENNMSLGAFSKQTHAHTAQLTGIENKATFRKTSSLPKRADDINTNADSLKNLVAQSDRLFFQKGENQPMATRVKEQISSKVVFSEPLKTLENEDAKKDVQRETSGSPIILPKENSIVQVLDSSKWVNTPTTFAIETSDPIKNTPLSIIQIIQDSSIKTGAKPIVANIITPQKGQKKLNWGVTVGTHIQDEASLGFQAGLIVSKPLNAKWAIVSGLSFRQAKMARQNTNTYFAAADKASSVSSTPTLLKATGISIDKLYYLEMPMMVERKISKHFTCATGLKLSYLVGQSTEKRDTSVYWVNNGAYSDPKNLLNDVNATTLGLKRWDVEWIGGITFLPTRHIQLGLRYDLGLTNILNRANSSVYNRYVGLNLNYYF